MYTPKLETAVFQKYKSAVRTLETLFLNLKPIIVF